jgi:hypothetical protein
MHLFLELELDQKYGDKCEVFLNKVKETNKGGSHMPFI